MGLSTHAIGTRARASADDMGLLTPAQTSLLTDQYELAMAASYFKRGMNVPAVFELFVRHLPRQRHWLLVAGIGPALAMVQRMRFGQRELDYLSSLGFAEPFLSYLSDFASPETSTRCRRAPSRSRVSRS